MAQARTLDKRRKSIQNIRKITRTMELIATARFKKAMDRAQAATAYTQRISAIVANLAKSGLEVSHPLLEERESTQQSILLVLSANRGLCGGYNGNVLRIAFHRWRELTEIAPHNELEVSGKRGISACRFRKLEPSRTYTHFENNPTFAEVEVLANRYLESYIAGRLDRLDVAYMRFDSASKQTAIVRTLLPLSSLGETDDGNDAAEGNQYEFMPSATSILEEVVPTSFKVKLFKCFLDAAVGEQVARMVAMKAATENADDLIRRLKMQYNRARQSQITGEIMEILGGVEALK